jgi:hypothetical protein
VKPADAPALEDAMQPQERIAAIVEQFRSQRYPAEALADIHAYLSGRDTLVKVQALTPSPNWYMWLPTEALAGLTHSDGARLDEIGARLLDICQATKNETVFIHGVASDGPAEEVRDRLVAHRQAEPDVVRSLLFVRDRLATVGQPTKALDRVLLSYLPDRFDLLVPGRNYAPAMFVGLLRLLLDARPPYLELAWRAAEDRLRDAWLVRDIAPLLLRADRAYFFDLVRPAMLQYIAEAGYGWQELLDLLLAEEWEGRLP